MRGCLKIGGDAVPDNHQLKIIRDIPARVTAKIIEKYNLQEFKVKYPLEAWPKFYCGCSSHPPDQEEALYQAATPEEQMSWNHNYSCLVVAEDKKAEGLKVYLFCEECAQIINNFRIECEKIHNGIG